MHQYTKRKLAPVAILCVVLVFASFASNSKNLNDGLRRRLENDKKIAEDSSIENATVAATAESPATTKRKSNRWDTPVKAKQETDDAKEQTQQETAPQKPQNETAPQKNTVTPQQLEAVASAVEVSKGEMEATDHLTKLHRHMCTDDWENADPLPYDKCDPNAPVNAIPLFGGLTNALKMILLGAVGSWEENRCFFVDESVSHLNPPDEKGVRHGFLHKYMEPIGLPLDHPLVVKAKEEGRIVKRNWEDFWNEMSARRAYGQIAKLPTLGFEKIEGHNLKRELIRRMWHPLPKYRQSSCSAMEKNHGLKAGEYMAFSVRRGDKTEEKFAFTDLKDYIDEAQNHKHRFSSFKQDHGGSDQMPKIFVATDDCSVMAEFRRMRPAWIFVSECDVEDNSKAAAQNGFALSDFKNWGEAAEDAHFTKFFTEIYAMAMSRVFIGVRYTNVSWWVYFLRPFRHSFVLLDTPKGEHSSRIFNNW